MSSLVQYEPSVDIVTEKFLDQTEVLFSSKNAICNFAEWLQFLAFDVIGQITYSKSHGFVDRGEDVDGMVGYLGNLFSYVAPVCLFAPREYRCCAQHLFTSGWPASCSGPIPSQKSASTLPRQARNHVFHLPCSDFCQSLYERAPQR